MVGPRHHYINTILKHPTNSLRCICCVNRFRNSHGCMRLQLTLLSTCRLMRDRDVHLSVCLSHETHTQGNAVSSKTKQWSLLTTNRKSYVGFSTNPLSSPKMTFSDSKPRPVLHSEPPSKTSPREIYASGDSWRP